jgi:hypothetical protein
LLNNEEPPISRSVENPMSKWMYTHRRKLKAKAVLDVLLPGTHDSGMCLGCRPCYPSIPIHTVF